MKVPSNTHKGGWRHVSLKSVGTVLCGQSPPSTAVNRQGGGVPYISGPEHWDGAAVHLDKWTTEPKRLVPSGCVFVTVKGAGVGTVFPGVESAIGRDIYAFLPNEELDSRFAEHVLRHTAFEIIRSARGDIPGLSKAHLLDHEIWLPSTAEQRRIVAEIEKQFTRLDAGLASLKRLQANLRRYHGAVLNEACNGRLAVTDHGDIVDKISGAADWEWTTLGAIADVKGGLTKDQNRTKAYRRSFRSLSARCKRATRVLGSRRSETDKRDRR